MASDHLSIAKLVCYSCGSDAHMADDCPPCYDCGEPSHGDELCPQIDEEDPESAAPDLDYQLRRTSSIALMELKPADDLPRAATRKLERLRRPHLQLNFDPDSDARASWRRGDEARLYYKLPRGFDPLEMTGEEYRLHQIATQTGTYLHPRAALDHAGTNIIELQIWGTQAKCRAARISIKKWVQEHKDESTVYQKFAKVPAHIEEIEKRILKAHARQVRLEEFRRKAESRQDTKYIKFLKWTETSWSRDAVLGRNLEALDDIRMKQHCYIDFIQHPTEGPAFQVAGNSSRKTTQAIQRIIGIGKQLLARQFDCRQFLLIQPFDDLKHRLDRSLYTVHQNPYTRPQYISTLYRSQDNIEDHVFLSLVLNKKGKHEFLSNNQKLARTIGDLMPDSLPRIGARCWKELNSQFISSWLCQTLETLPYFAGFLRMRARLGTFIVTNYLKTKTNTYSVGELEDLLRGFNMEENQLEGYFTQE
jgi:hypothetical protein